MNTTPTPSTSFLLTPTQAYTLPSSSTKFLDTTWFMPNSPRNARQEFEKARIRGAKYFDLDEVASPNELGLKHMMPSSEQFKEACDQLGITKEDSVVLYDVHGVFSSPRALFAFKAFGHPKAFVLNGGLPAWRAAGLSVDESQLPSGEPVATGGSGAYPLPSMDPSIIRSYEQMLENTKRESEDAELVLDARPKARFMGSAPEPRAGLPSGHMPNSVSIPFTNLLTTHEYSHDVPKSGLFTPYLSLFFSHGSSSSFPLLSHTRTGNGNGPD
ncbi:hypothetical protein FRC19_008155 [Serendipita sp. 401]|nr:hypothetical protein FRC19_008155 [Serendipita sp. 401]KAG9057116.1 hypothetical protein FS842_008599 [Serendipita sp. 407]